MTPEERVRAWRDPDYREAMGLTDDEHPAGPGAPPTDEAGGRLGTFWIFCIKIPGTVIYTICRGSTCGRFCYVA